MHILAAPVHPTRGELRPLSLGAVRLDPDGFWGRRQELNANAILPHCHTWVERSGAVDNLRLVRTGTLPGARRGREFADSDVYKLLEAMAWESGRQGGSADLDAGIDEIAAVLATAQDADGYLGSMFGHPGQRPRYSDLEWGHELYCYGHLIQAGVARLRCHGEDQLTEVVRRAADHVCRRFSGSGICGHPEIETALVELYRATGEERYLEQAAAFVERRGRRTLADIEWGRAYFQDDVPVRDRRAFSGHAVREMYFAAGAVDVAVETGDRSLLDAIIGQWERSVAARTYLTGGIGSRHTGEAFGEDYELPPDRAYAETCAAVAMVMLCWRLTLATGQARFADQAERTLFNAVAVSPSTAGDAYFYSNPLQIRTPGEPVPPNQLDLRSSGKLRSTWFDVSCCPPNLSRLLGSLAGYQATESDDGLQLHQLSAGEVRGGGLSVRIETGYPWDGDVAIHVEAADDRPRALSIRVPAWAEGASMRVGADPSDVPVRPGYVTETRLWRPGDDLRLSLPLVPRWTWPDRRIDAIRECVAVERGPLVYCAESSETLDDLAVDAGAEPNDTVPVPWGADAVGVAVVAERSGLEGGNHGWPYGSERVPATRTATLLTMLPYHLRGNNGPAAMRVFLPLAR